MARDVWTVDRVADDADRSCLPHLCDHRRHDHPPIRERAVSKLSLRLGGPRCGSGVDRGLLDSGLVWAARRG